LKRRLKRPAEALLRAFARVIAPALGVIARRGIGSEHFLRRGFLAVPLHYYQPIFDPETVPESVWTRRHDLPGIDFEQQGQLKFLEEIGSFGEECVWPERATTGYYAQNGSFGYSSGALLHATVRHLAPERVVEVGAGMSTLLIAAALERNGRGVLTTIDPNPREQVADLPEHREVVSDFVERMPLDTFDVLRSGDLLFIDSSHVVRWSTSTTSSCPTSTRAPIRRARTGRGPSGPSSTFSRRSLPRTRTGRSCSRDITSSATFRNASRRRSRTGARRTTG
jgi:hypothetical protein